MATIVTIVVTFAAILVGATVAVQCLRLGWSKSGYLHDGGPFVSDWGDCDAGDCGGE